MARASSLEDNFATKVLEPRNLQSHGTCRHEEPDADKIIASAVVAVSSTMKISFLALQGGSCFANEGSRNGVAKLIIYTYMIRIYDRSMAMITVIQNIVVRTQQPKLPPPPLPSPFDAVPT